MPEDQDKALVASSEFDPSNFIKGIDAMTAALQKLSAQEDQIRSDIRNTNAQLTANRNELKSTADQINALDKSAKTYSDDLARLNTQQTNLKNQQRDLQAAMKTSRDSLGQVNNSANAYRDALQGITTISKQVADENKGRSLFDVVSLNQQVAEVVGLGAKLRNIFQGKISTEELDKFEQSLAGTGDEMKQLGTVLDFVKSKLGTLDPNSQEFADLNKVIAVGEQVLDEYGKTLETVAPKSVSLRTQLKSLRDELARLEEQGLDNTKEFEQLQIAAGKLQDQIGDTQNRIRVLSSDTKNIDFGIGAIRGVASAFGVAEGAAALFGLKNEDVAKSIQRLNSIMLILNGLQEIQNLLQKQSVVAIVGQEIATKAAAIAQRIYAVAVGTSSGAMKAFRVALLTSGIGAFLLLLGLAVSAMDLFGSSTEDATNDSDAFNTSLSQNNILLETNTRIIKTNTAIRDEQIKRNAKFSTDQTTQTKNQIVTEQQLQANKIQSLQEEKTELQSRLVILRQSQDAFLDAGKSEGDFIEKSNAQAATIFSRVVEIDDQLRVEREKSITKTVEDQRHSLERQAQLYQVYLERITNLQRQLRDKTLAAQPQDETVIRQQFANQLSDALADLDQDVKTGKVSRGRALVLQDLIKQINTVDLTAGTKAFADESLKAETELTRQIEDIRIRSGHERADLIREQFTREAAIVRAESRNEANDLTRERNDIIKSINETQQKGLISTDEAKINVERITTIYDQLLENLKIRTTRKQEEITSETFQAAQQSLQTVFSGIQLTVSESATREIQEVTQRFISGRVTYERYQKELTRIAEDESLKRITTSISENKNLLQGVQDRIKLEQDPDRLKSLKEQESQLRAQIADLQRQLAIATGQQTQQVDEDLKNKIARVAAYAVAINSVVQAVVGFWNEANEAEQRSLERSISLQQKRVDAATTIAERGNAEFLRLEQDRLDELTLKQENAARRQLAINAVLQTSQALTAFITALSQGIATGGPLGGIAIAAAVIGLIASGYAIITSLQKQNTQTFRTGTKYVQRKEGERPGVDTVHAMLDEGEAVVPRETNKEYKPAVEAIIDKKVSSKEINEFVSKKSRVTDDDQDDNTAKPKKKRRRRDDDQDPDSPAFRMGTKYVQHGLIDDVHKSRSEDSKIEKSGIEKSDTEKSDTNKSSVEKSGISKVAESDTSKTDKSDVSKIDRSDLSSIEKSAASRERASSDSDKSESSHIDQSEKSGIDRSESSEVDKTDSSKVDKSESSKTDKAMASTDITETKAITDLVNENLASKSITQEHHKETEKVALTETGKKETDIVTDRQDQKEHDIKSESFWGRVLEDHKETEKDLTSNATRKDDSTSKEVSKHVSKDATKDVSKESNTENLKVSLADDLVKVTDQLSEKDQQTSAEDLKTSLTDVVNKVTDAVSQKDRDTSTEKMVDQASKATDRLSEKDQARVTDREKIVDQQTARAQENLSESDRVHEYSRDQLAEYLSDARTDKRTDSDHERSTDEKRSSEQITRSMLAERLTNTVVENAINQVMEKITDQSAMTRTDRQALISESVNYFMPSELKPVEIQSIRRQLIETLINKKAVGEQISSILEQTMSKEFTNKTSQEVTERVTEKVVNQINERMTASIVATVSERATNLMTDMVNSYRVNTRTMTTLDHRRLAEVADVVVSYDGQLLSATREHTRMLAEHSELLEKLDHRLAGLGISATMDKNGIAVHLMKAVEQMKIDKRV